MESISKPMFLSIRVRFAASKKVSSNTKTIFSKYAMKISTYFRSFPSLILLQSDVAKCPSHCCNANLRDDVFEIHFDDKFPASSYEK
mmetsp:Transcript_15897/g.20746  ORF Transcript_15897/g.20746 Transcript_15897/m.20746 type:complete len:87 (-) Transcript_15897:127-387(-)